MILFFLGISEQLQFFIRNVKPCEPAAQLEVIFMENNTEAEPSNYVSPNVSYSTNGKQQSSKAG
jgi:hypothetical protein